MTLFLGYHEGRGQSGLGLDVGTPVKEEGAYFFLALLHCRHQGVESVVSPDVRVGSFRQKELGDFKVPVLGREPQGRHTVVTPMASK